jgi:DNA-binding CsgD family transcriptional regulator
MQTYPSLCWSHVTSHLTPRDLDEHDIVSRIMRKDNYLIALINKGVLQLTPPPLTQAAAAMAVMVVQGAAQATARGLAGAASTLGGGAAGDGAGASGTGGTGLGATMRYGANGYHELDSEAGDATQPLLHHNHNGGYHQGGEHGQALSPRQRRQQALSRRGVISQRLLQCSEALQMWAEGAQLAPGRACGNISSTSGCWGWLLGLCWGRQRQGGEGNRSGPGKAGGATRSSGRAAPAARKPLLTKTLEWNLRW